MKKIFLVVYAFLLLTCTKEQTTPRPYPRVETHEVANITSSGALFQGEITYTTGDVIDHGFIWSLIEVPSLNNSDTVSLGANAMTGRFSATITRNLIQGQKYYVRAYAKSGTYLVYGEIQTFISLGSDVAFVIESVMPNKHLMPGDIVTVKTRSIGNTFQVKLNGKVLAKVNIFGLTNSSFRVHLPDSLQKLNSISITRLGSEVIVSPQLSSILSFRKKIDLSSAGISASANCVVNDKGFFGFGFTSTSLTNSMFSYDPSSDLLVAINQQSISPRYSPVSFSILGVGYFGGGLDYYNGFRDFYSIVPSSNLISQLSDIPIPDPSVQFNNGTFNNGTLSGFSINDKGYCLTHLISPTNKNAFYEFDPSKNLWTQKADFPGVTRTSGYGNIFPIVSFVSNGIAYIGGGATELGSPLNDWWSYDPALDSWSQLRQNKSLSGTYTALNLNGKVYLITSNGQIQFYEFLPSNGTFVACPFSSKIRLSLNGSFSIGTSGYLYAGSSIWEFDPSM